MATTYTSKEAKDRFGVMMDTARREPVVITRHNRPAVVVISSERYAELEALENNYWIAKAQEGLASGLLTSEESIDFLHKAVNADTDDQGGN